MHGLRAISAVTIGTSMGAGLFPIAPGTMGTLIGVPLAWWSSTWSMGARLSLWVGLAALGTWACKEFDEIMQSHDNQNLVIDETLGLGITAWTIGRGSGMLAWFAAFALFRFFDILKPPPVRQVDRWSKTGSAWLGGFGVMADDIVAGFQALLVMIALQSLHWI